MTRYWLSRGQGQAAEGPFFLAQIEGMFRAGSITADAVICEVGKEDWQPVVAAPGPQQVPSGPRRRQPAPPSQAAMVERGIELRDEKLVKAWYLAADLLMIGTCVVAFIPGIGLLAWLAMVVVGLIALVLGILMMTKGRVGRGIWTIGCAFVLMPGVVLLGNIVGFGMLANFNDQLTAKANEMKAATHRPRVEPRSALPEGATEKQDEFTKRWHMTFATGKYTTPYVMVRPSVAYHESSVDVPAFVLSFHRHHDDWSWLKYRQTAWLIDGEVKNFESDFESDTGTGGMVHEWVSVAIPPVDWAAIVDSKETKVRIGVDDLVLTDENKSQMRAVYVRWYDSGGGAAAE